jgi:hypothetical protein
LGQSKVFGIFTKKSPIEDFYERTRVRAAAFYHFRRRRFDESEAKTLSSDLKREVLRHMVATVAYRGGLAVVDAPASFAEFRTHETTRTPGEILAHIGDLLEGSLYLVKGEMVFLTSAPLPWKEEVARFFSAVNAFDAYLASDGPMACAVERLVQGPVGDALTHVGQIVMLRRMAGIPIRSGEYFTAEIVPGAVTEDHFS